MGEAGRRQAGQVRVAERLAKHRRFGTAGRLSAALAAAWAAAAGLPADQLFVGVDNSDVFTQIGDVSDLADVNYSPLFDGLEVWGATFDSIEADLWLSSGVDLYRAEVGGSPEHVAELTSGGEGASMTGLAFAHGALYGFRSTPAAGIYEIDTTTGVADLVLAIPFHDFGGLDFNAADGLFYGTNDSTAQTGRGLYSIDVFGGGALTLIAAYPSGQTDIDGLAVGGGHAHLITDEPGSFYAYDLSQGPGGVYTPFANPWSATAAFSAAAYIPEPATLGFVAAALIVAARRHRRRS